MSVLSKKIGSRESMFRASIEDPDGTSLVDVILVKQGLQWKFDDIWVESIYGKRADMPMSYSY